MLSVLWHCWLGGRKGIWPVKNWAVGCWCDYLSGARCRRICPSSCHCHSLSLASVKSRLISPFWYWLTRVVPEKGSLKGCVCVLVWSACLLVTISCAKTSESIEMPFRIWTRVEPTNHVSVGGPNTPKGRDNLGGGHLTAQCNYYYYYYCTHLTASFPGQPG